MIFPCYLAGITECTVKLRLRLDDQHTREVWATVQRAKAEVAGWPAWKRGESHMEDTTDERTNETE